jgi:hypothetical protein
LIRELDRRYHPPRETGKPDDSKTSTPKEVVMKRRLTGLFAFALVLGVTTQASAQCRPDTYAPGDLLIVEIFPDATGDDTGKEWIEVYNNAACAKNLKGLTIKWKKPDGSWDSLAIPDTVAAIPQRGVVMLGKYPGKTPAYDLKGRLSLKDASGEVQILTGTTVIDKIDYKGVSTGKSIFRPLLWACKPPDCTEMGTGTSDYGSPGTANPHPNTGTWK